MILNFNLAIEVPDQYGQACVPHIKQQIKGVLNRTNPYELKGIVFTDVLDVAGAETLERILDEEGKINL